MDVMVFYHGQHDFLMFSGRMGHRVYKGLKIQTQVRVQEVQQLSRYTYGDYGYEGSGGRKRMTCRNHKYDDCMYQTLNRMMKEATEDSCSVPWILNTDNICRKKKDINATFWIHWTQFLNQKTICDYPCLKVIIDVHGKNYESIKSNSGDLWSFFAFDVAKGEENLLYTGINVAAEVRNFV